jgi:hypothetical protein
MISIGSNSSVSFRGILGPGNESRQSASVGGGGGRRPRIRQPAAQGHGSQSASGAVRLAGSHNFKAKYARNFSLDRSWCQPPPPTEPPGRCSDQPRRLAWPSYERCLEGAPESTSGGKKRSAADFTWCCIAIDHFRRTPAETARIN